MKPPRQPIGERAIRPGALIDGTYRLGELLGAGGMGQVYEAEHAALGRKVALKVLRPGMDDVEGTSRFRREMRAVAALTSEHVVSVFDCGALEDGTPYFVMERLEGQDLRQVLRSFGPLPVRRAVHALQHALRGIAVAHRAGIVHRDLKPENLFLVARARGGELCKVLDFGAARMDSSLATRQGAVIGTIRYMAPEQLADASRVGPASDIYALGAILYECLTGRPPHVADAMPELMFKIMNERPPPVTTLKSNIPPALAAIIERALSHAPEQRFPSAEAFDEALDTFTGGASPTVAGPSDVTASFGESVRAQVPEVGPAALSVSNVGQARRQRGMWLSIAGLLAVSVLVIFWLANRRDQLALPAAPRAGQTSSVASVASPPKEPRDEVRPPSAPSPAIDPEGASSKAAVARPQKPAASIRAPKAKAAAVPASAPTEPPAPSSATPRPHLNLGRENPYKQP
jgi:serine/threonine protein kinase